MTSKRIQLPQGKITHTESRPDIFIMSGCKAIPTCSRILSVVGLIDRLNDIITCGDTSTATRHVLYFGGDVQDYTENMESHRDNHKYKQWNLEDTAKLLHSKFPSSTVMVVRPSRMHLKTFSVYKNFVESNDFGCPSHSASQNAISHLSKLYTNVLSELNSASKCLPLTLIGFSKGCVVLNQIVYELVNIENLDSETQKFVNQIKEFYWLDGGHSGGKNTWVTDDASLLALSKLNCSINVHVTPYQVKDEMRSWIGREERQFVKTLRKHGTNVFEQLHFETDERCIENHFRVLEVFK